MKGEDCNLKLKRVTEGANVLCAFYVWFTSLFCVHVSVTRLFNDDVSSNDGTNVSRQLRSDCLPL
jgi:hypothetical protein